MGAASRIAFSAGSYGADGMPVQIGLQAGFVCLSFGLLNAISNAVQAPFWSVFLGSVPNWSKNLTTRVAYRKHSF